MTTHYVRDVHGCNIQYSTIHIRQQKPIVQNITLASTRKSSDKQAIYQDNTIAQKAINR